MCEDGVLELGERVSVGGFYAGLPLGGRAVSVFQLIECDVMKRGISALERGASKQQLGGRSIDKPGQRTPSDAQDIGIGVIWVDAKTAEFGHRGRIVGKAFEIVELGGVAGEDFHARGERCDAKATDEGVRLDIFDQDMVAVGVECIGIGAGGHKAAICDETKVTQGHRAVYVLRRSGHAGGVATFGQWQH